jgi:hypothetical protein
VKVWLGGTEVWYYNICDSKVVVSVTVNVRMNVCADIPVSLTVSE